MKRNIETNAVDDRLDARWSFAVLVIMASICWVVLRFEYLPQFAPASLQLIYEFKAAPPFGRRILMAWLAHVGVWAGLSVPHAFELLDIASTIALVAGLVKLFRMYVQPRAARMMGFGIFIVLPYLFFAPSLCNDLHLWPYDMPAWAFTAWGLYWILAGRWKMVALLMVLASFNRESAVLLPLVWLAVWVDRKPWWRAIGVGTLLVAIYVACQLLIEPTLSDNVVYYTNLQWGMSMDLGTNWRLMRNWCWLTECGQRPVVLLGTMALLPVILLWQSQNISPVLRRSCLAGWVYFWMLMLVGNVYEARIYGEISVLWYVPLALLAWKCISGENVFAGFSVVGEKNWMEPWMKWLEWGAFIVPPLGVIALGWCLSHRFS